MNAKIQRAAPCDHRQGLSDRPLALEFLCEERASSGNAYDLYLGRISKIPVVRSHATGKYFKLPWSQIIKLAVEEGLDQDEPEAKETAPIGGHQRGTTPAGS